MITPTEDADNNVSSFFRFLANKPIFVEFLSKWLRIREVGKLDSAMTNSKHRGVFLQCVEEMRNNTIDGIDCSASMLGNFQSFIPPGIGQFVGGMLEKMASLASPHLLGNQNPPAFKEGHSTTLLKWISKRRIYVKSMTLSNFKDGEQALFIGSLQLLVQKLDVNRCSLRHIAQSCPLLEELTMNESMMRDEGDILHDLAFLCRHCTHLQRIRLKKFTLQSTALNDLQEFGHLFEEIDTHSRDGLVTNTMFMDFIKRCTNLKLLSIFNIDRRKPTVADFEAMLQLEALEDLTFIDCGLSNEKLALICRCRNVKKLGLFEHDRNAVFTAAGFGALNGSPLSLTLESITFECNSREFDTRGFNDESLMAAGLATCHNLRSIDLHTRRLADDAFLEVSSPSK